VCGVASSVECVCVCVCSCVSATAFTVVARGAKQIQSNGNTLESNSCSVKEEKQNQRTAGDKQLLELLDDTV